MLVMKEVSPFHCIKFFRLGDGTSRCVLVFLLSLNVVGISPHKTRWCCPLLTYFMLIRVSLVGP